MSYVIARTSIADRWHGLSLEAQERVAKEFDLAGREHGFIVARDISLAMVEFGESP